MSLMPFNFYINIFNEIKLFFTVVMIVHMQ